MTKDEIAKFAAEIGAKAAIQHIEKHTKQVKKSRTDYRLHNTKLLLKNYNLLKDHCENSVDNFKTAVQNDSESAIDILDALQQCEGNQYIESIKRSMARTFTMVTHISEMLEYYRIYCERTNKPEDKRRYRILIAYYIGNEKIADIAKTENIDERTYYRDMKQALLSISSLIFGIDGLSEMSQ